MDTIRIYVGFDQREAVAYHVFTQSVIERATQPVEFHPLARGMLGEFDGQRDGSNAFVYSRYMVPYLCDFSGYALFCDGDMVADRDIAELWAEKGKAAVSVVKHDYSTRHPRKYIGTKMESMNVDYPRKNWSSVMLWNCAHPANKILTPEYVGTAGGEQLHRFKWLKDEQIGELPASWNYLVKEYPPGSANLFHYTLGISGIKYYADDHGSWKWHTALLRALECAGEKTSEMIQRAEGRIGELQ